MAISQIPALIAYISFLLRAEHLADQVWADLTPFKWQFHRFLLYPESSYLADHVVANLPPFIWQFHTFLLWLLIFLSYSKSSTFGKPGLGRSNPSQISISQILALLWELVFGRPGLGRTAPISKDNFTDSCSTLRVHIWLKSVCRSTHPLKWQFYRFLLNSESSYLADQVLADLPPFKWLFNRFLLWLLIFLSYSKSSYLADAGLDRSTPITNGNFTDSCSDSSYFFPTLRVQHLADQVLAHLSLFQMAISVIPALIWKLVFGRFLSYSESSILEELPLISKGYFKDFCCDCSYFFPTLRVHI